MYRLGTSGNKVTYYSRSEGRWDLSLLQLDPVYATVEWMLSDWFPILNTAKAMQWVPLK